MEHVQERTGTAATGQGAGQFIKDQAQSAVMGLITGFMGALLGVGGGIILVPMLTGIVKMSQHRAHGTSIAVVTLTSITAAWRYWSAGNLDLAAVATIAAASIIGAMLGVRLCNRVPARQLRMVFGAFLFLVGVTMVATGSASGVTSSTQAAAAIGNGNILVSLGIGLVAGTISGLLGIGGGPILVPAGVFLLGFPQQLAQGVSAGVIVPTSITGAISHYKSGNTIVSMVLGLAVAAIVGAFLGAEVANRLPNEILRRLFGILLICLAIQTYWRFYGKQITQKACELTGRGEA